MGELIAVFGAGLASAASPCLLPLDPGFIAYLTANAGTLHARRASGLLGLLVLAGLLAMDGAMVGSETPAPDGVDPSLM